MSDPSPSPSPLRPFLFALFGLILPIILNSILLPSLTSPSPSLFTQSQLSLYDGSNPSQPIYLAILGKIFDVSRAPEHYSQEGGYGFFSGRDGSRAFITGQFNEAGLIDKVDDLNNAQIKALFDWVQFYEEEYILVGYLVGTFYDGQGNPTKYLRNLEERRDLEIHARDEEKVEEERYPKCNVRYRKKEGTTYWCTKNSGGVERDWNGFPRRMMTAKGKERCACVPKSEAFVKSERFQVYEGCKPEWPTCGGFLDRENKNGV